MTDSEWQILKDTREAGSPWRNLVVEGPGVLYDRRKFWLAWNCDRGTWRKNNCYLDMYTRHPEMLRHLAKQMKTTHPKYY